jgi:hypothetical protein
MTRPLAWICACVFWSIGAAIVAARQPVSWQAGAVLAFALGLSWFVHARRAR